MSEAQTEDMWTPYKDLYSSIEYNLTRDLQIPSQEFEMMLRKFKQSFFCLLQNTPKNPKLREDIKKGMTDGVAVRGIGNQILSKDLFQELTIISDMYDLNEYMALDLLCTAQIQLSYHPGLTRGLVAILLYYDGRKALVSSLRLLFQARNGILFRLGIPEAVSTYITIYTNQLIENGIFTHILELLRTLDLSKEVELLQKNRALGDAKHHRQIMDLFEEIRQQLADCIYLYAAQSGLNREQSVGLINHLRKTKLEEDASGGIDNVTLTLQMALLYALDLSVLHVREDGEEIVQKLPLISENGLIECLITELNRSKWDCEELQALSYFAMGICLASLRQVPQSHQMAHLIEQDDQFASAAIDMKVFTFILNVVMKNEMIFRERFFYYRLHNLFTDFIVIMQNNVKELRLRADETARTLQAYAQEGLDAPASLPRYLEQFMLCIAKLYARDELKMELMLEYWSPVDLNPGQTFPYRTPARTVALYKFLRQAGDMMPVSLFVPYLTMIAGLASHSQSARFCFNMLKQSQSSTITWDHFFSSFTRYLGNLRSETPTTTDTVYRHRNFPRGITPQEINGLHAVLLVIKTVAEFDPFSRIALCEHPIWAPLNILLGLVSCSVPIPLKSMLLQTLAALSKSPETAAQMWNNLEESQVVVTVPSTSSYQPRGIQTELDEIEARLEEFPMTRAFLELLDVLTDTGIPRTLGAGPRKPGFDPYLTFIVNSVFLKFYNRAYKNNDEKWNVGRLCLKLLEKFLIQYEPNLADFPDGSQTPEFNPPPGFHLMVQLNSKSQFLDLILFIIDETCNLFDLYENFPGKKYLGDCSLSCLNIINRALTLQQKFFNLLSSSTSALLLTHLNKLLLNLNPRTAKPDYMLKICKFVGFHSLVPKHALVATKVLIQITKQPSIHANIMNILLSYSELDTSIRFGFVLCLDADENDETTLTKEWIIKLLKQCLNHSPPNFTHYLCGFDVKHDISRTVFQFPGVLNFPRTCLHSLFSILNSGLNKNPKKPSLMEAGYSMLYALCENSKTSTPVLRFLRQTQNFFQNHIQAIPQTKLTSTEMNQVAWLLKTIAIEQKICSTTNQNIYLKHLTKLLVGFPLIIEEKESDTIDLTESNNVGRVNLLNNLIKNIDFASETQKPPQFGHLDHTVMIRLIGECENLNPPKLIDVKKLHQVLMNELSTLQGPAASQRTIILQEIQIVLTYCLKLNQIRQNAAAVTKYIDAWRQLVQIIFVTLPSEVMTIEEQQIVLIELIETLLNKIQGKEMLSEVATLISASILVLLKCLRQSHLHAISRKNVSPIDSADKTYQNLIYTNTTSLKFILHSLLEWIITSGVSSQRLRVNLYGALIEFLELISVGYDDNKLPNQTGFYVSRIDHNSDQLSDDRILISANVFSSFGDKIIEVISQDCIGGHDVCKMLAMSSFNLLIKLNLQSTWVGFLSSKGYITHLIDSILNSDSDLKSILETTPDSLQSMYLYETKMALLARISTSRPGAELLLEQRILACLGSMKVFDDHPKIERQQPNITEDFIPTVEKRYQQILFPALDLSDSLLTTLGTDNRCSVAQIINFLINHLDVVENVLTLASPTLSAPFLKELAKITGLIARTANNDLCSILETQDATPADRAYLTRLQRLMLAILPRFVLTDNVIKELTSGSDEIEPNSDRLLDSMQVASNLILYAKNLTANHDVEHTSASVVFQPSLSDPLAISSRKYQYSHYSEQSPSIGAVVQQLIQCVQYYHKEKVTLNFLSKKVVQVPSMNSIDLKEFITPPTHTFNIFEIREEALEKLLLRLKDKQQEMDHIAFLIENCLYLIWAHLDYYMLKAIPKVKNYGLANETFNVSGISPETTWKVTADDISNLKQGLVSIFNDTFSRHLLETTQDRSELDRGFLEVLLRRIKRLIQFVPVK